MDTQGLHLSYKQASSNFKQWDSIEGLKAYIIYITCTVNENLQFFSTISISDMQFRAAVGLIGDTWANKTA